MLVLSHFVLYYCSCNHFIFYCNVQHLRSYLPDDELENFNYFSTFLLIFWKFHQNYYKQLKVCDISSMNQSKVNYIMDQSCDCLVNIT